jgi:purine nucleoside phosphorylase
VTKVKTIFRNFPLENAAKYYLKYLTPICKTYCSIFRHGRGNRINPTNVNYRANIWALQQAGCTHILVTTACGSLHHNIHPTDIVVIDQFIDR